MRPVRLLFLICFLSGLSVLASAANKYALVKAQDNLTLRAKTELAAPRIETLLRFQPVEVLERKTVDKREWARIRTIKADASKSSTGWVLGEYLTDSAFAISNGDKLNVRRGPGTNYDVIMHYGRNYPVQVLDVASNGWVKLRDVDGDMGWVHPGQLGLEPWVITAGPYKVFNIRDGIGAEKPLKFRAEKGYPLQVLEEKNGWLHVRDQDKTEGWISAKIVFGWLDPDYPKAGAGDDQKAPAKSSPEKSGAAKSADKSAAKN